MEAENELKFCVCAMVDLIGFSSHLEISAYDLRTHIGKQAVRRLESMEKILTLLESEKTKWPEYYPMKYQTQRINDALFITMDLDDLLVPPIGKTHFNGLPIEKLSSIFPDDSDKPVESMEPAYHLKGFELIEPLLKFIGLVARYHISLNKSESENNFPGAKTVIASGFRRSFISPISKQEDHFSANFSLSNAYLAEKSLKGANIYLDEGLTKLVSWSKYSRNIMKLSHFQFKEASFDCFSDVEDVFQTPTEPSIHEPITVDLFRKKYKFRSLNPSPLTYLQNIPSIFKYLSEKEEPSLSNIYYRHIYKAIKFGVTGKSSKCAPSSFIFNDSNDFSDEIHVMTEYLSEGKSGIREAEREARYKQNFIGLNEEGKIKMKELLESTIELKTELSIEGFKESLFALGERARCGTANFQR